MLLILLNNIYIYNTHTHTLKYLFLQEKRYYINIIHKNFIYIQKKPKVILKYTTKIKGGKGWDSILGRMGPTKQGGNKLGYSCFMCIIPYLFNLFHDFGVRGCVPGTRACY